MHARKFPLLVRFRLCGLPRVGVVLRLTFVALRNDLVARFSFLVQPFYPKGRIGTLFGYRVGYVIFRP